MGYALSQGRLAASLLERAAGQRPPYLRLRLGRYMEAFPCCWRGGESRHARRSPGFMNWPQLKMRFASIFGLEGTPLCGNRARAEAARLQAALDAATEALLTLDAEGRIGSINRRGLEMFGYRRDEMLGAAVETLFGATELLGQLGAPPAALRSVKVAARRKSGDAFPAEVTLSGAETQEMRIYVIRVDDLSRRESVQADAENQPGDWRDIVSDSSGALIHEINQPLAAAATYLSAARRILARSDPPNGELALILDKAARQTQRASGLVATLRNFLQRSEPNRTTARLHRLIEDGVEELRAEGAFGDLGVALEPAAARDGLAVDGPQISAALRNLLREAAAEIRSRDGRTLSIRTANPDPETIQVDLLDAHASASGAESSRELLTLEKSKGMRPGLLTSAIIIENHQGHIWIASNRQERFLFRFVLPLQSPDSAS